MTVAEMVGVVSAPRPKEEVNSILGEFHVALKDQDVDGAQAVAIRFSDLAGRDEDLHSKLYLELSEEAHRREWAGEWDGAETIYRAALAMASHEHLPGQQFRNHHALSTLFDLLESPSRALEEAELAQDAIKDVYFPLGTYMAHYALCKRALTLGDTATALKNAEKLVESEKDPNVSRAHSLLVRASCLVQMGDQKRATQDLDMVELLLKPEAKNRHLAGVQSGLADMWSLRARLLVPEDWTGALEAMWEAVQLRRHVAALTKLDGPFKFNALAISLYQFSTIAKEKGNMESAAVTLTESDAIRDRIHLFPYREIGFFA